MNAVPHAKRRGILTGVLLGVIALGLASRKWANELPTFIAANAGDALWTVAVFLSLAIALPRWSSLKLGAVAFGISVAVELSQLIDADWLNSLRRTLPGSLLLGSGFLWIDLPRYGVGAVIATLADDILRRRPSSD